MASEDVLINIIVTGGEDANDAFDKLADSLDDNTRRQFDNARATREAEAAHQKNALALDKENEAAIRRKKSEEDLSRAIEKGTKNVRLARDMNRSRVKDMIRDNETLKKKIARSEEALAKIQNTSTDSYEKKAAAIERYRDRYTKAHDRINAVRARNLAKEYAAFKKQVAKLGNLSDEQRGAVSKTFNRQFSVYGGSSSKEVKNGYVMARNDIRDWLEENRVKSVRDQEAINNKYVKSVRKLEERKNKNLLADYKSLTKTRVEETRKVDLLHVKKAIKRAQADWYDYKKQGGGMSLLDYVQFNNEKKIYNWSKADRVYAKRQDEIYKIEQRGLKKQAALLAKRRDFLKRFSVLNNKGVFGTFGITGRRAIATGIGFLVGAVIDAIGFLATALNALIAGTAALVSAMGPLFGILNTAPALLSGFGLGLFTVIFGMQGVIEAFDGTKKSLDKLNPSARTFVTQMIKAKPYFKALQYDIQGLLFRGMGRELTQFALAFRVVFAAVTRATAADTNKGVLGTLRWMRSADGLPVVNEMLGQSARVWHELVVGAGLLLRIFMRLASSGGEGAVTLLEAINRQLSRANEWIRKNDEWLRQFTVNSVTAWGKLLKWIGAFARGMYNILKIAKPFGDDLTGNLTEMINNFERWTKSVEGQNKLKKFFDDMREPFYQVVGLLWGFIKGIVALGRQKSFVETVKALREELGPALMAIIQAAEGQFIPRLVSLFTAIARAAEGGLIEQVGEAFGVLVTVLEKLLDIWDRMPTVIKEHGFEFLVAGWLVSGSAKLVFGGMFDILTGLASIIILAPKAGKILADTWAVMNARPGQILYSNMPGVAARGGGGALAGLGAAMGPILAVVGALALVGTQLYYLYETNEMVRDAMNQFGQDMKSLFEPFKPLIESIRDAFSGLGFEINATDLSVGNLVSLVGVLSGPLSGPLLMFPGLVALGVKMLGILVTTIVGTISYIASMLGLLATIVWTGVRVVAAIFQWLWNTIWFGADWLWKKILAGAEWLWNKLPEGFTSNVETAIMKIGDAWDYVVGKFRAFLESDTARAIIDFFTMLNAGVKGAGEKISGAGDSFIEWLKKHTPGREHGGMTLPGMTYLTGEAGPELTLTKAGMLGVVGLNGPQLFSPSTATAVIPHGASFNPSNNNFENTPSWAKSMLTGQLTQPQRNSNGGYEGPAIVIENINASSDVDIEAALTRAYEKMMQRRKERAYG